MIDIEFCMLKVQNSITDRCQKRRQSTTILPPAECKLTFGFLCAAAFLCSCVKTNWGPSASDIAVRASPAELFSLMSDILSTRPLMAVKASFLLSLDDSLASKAISSNTLAKTYTENDRYNFVKT